MKEPKPTIDLYTALVESLQQSGSKGPVRHKYIEEHFPRWMKFGGWHGDSPDRGDVADVRRDIVTNIHRIPADKLIAARDTFIDKLLEIFEEHPEAFNVEPGTR